MSKYEALRNWIKENGTDNFKLTYEEIEKITGFPIDHFYTTGIMTTKEICDIIRYIKEKSGALKMLPERIEKTWQQ